MRRMLVSVVALALSACGSINGWEAELAEYNCGGSVNIGFITADEFKESNSVYCKSGQVFVLDWSVYVELKHRGILGQ